MMFELVTTLDGDHYIYLCMSPLGVEISVLGFETTYTFKATLIILVCS